MEPTLSPALKREIGRRLACGCELVSFAELNRRIAALGYRLDRSMDCRCTARDMATGESYPCVTGRLREQDSGMSFAHFEARRDANFRALQDLRQGVFAVLHGAIFDA